MPAALPAYADVKALIPTTYVSATGFPIDATITNILDGVVSDFENRTCYHPFLAAASDTTQYVSPNNNGDRLVVLDNGLCAFTSLTYRGAALTNETDFWLLPANAASKGKPWTEIRFLHGKSNLPYLDNNGPLAITGKWGYGVTVPQDVWEAIQGEAARRIIDRYWAVLADAVHALGGEAIVKAKETPQARFEYDTNVANNTILSQAKRWGKAYEDAVKGYRLNYGVR